MNECAAEAIKDIQVLIFRYSIERRGGMSALGRPGLKVSRYPIAALTGNAIRPLISPHQKPTRIPVRALHVLLACRIAMASAYCQEASNG
jgi:hypothetical protein